MKLARTFVLAGSTALASLLPLEARQSKPAAPQSAEATVLQTRYDITACLSDKRLFSTRVSQRATFNPALSDRQLEQADTMVQDYYGSMEYQLRALVKDLKSTEVTGEKGRKLAEIFREVIQPAAQARLENNLKSLGSFHIRLENQARRIPIKNEVHPDCVKGLKSADAAIAALEQ